MNATTATATATASVPRDPAETALNVVADMGLALSMAMAPAKLDLGIRFDAWGAAHLSAATPDPNVLIATVAVRPLGRERVSVHVIVTANKEHRARAAVTELMLAVPTLGITPTTVSHRSSSGCEQVPHPFPEWGPAESSGSLQ